MHSVSLHAHIGKIITPNLIAMINQQTFEQLGVNRGLQSTLAEIGSRINSLYAHIPHMGLNSFAVNGYHLCMKCFCYFARPKVWELGIDFVNSMFNVHLLL